MTPEERQQTLLHEHTRKQNLGGGFVGVLAFISLLIIVTGTDPALYLALLGAMWLVGFVFVYVDKHVHALLEYHQTVRSFYRNLDTGEASPEDSAREMSTLSDQDQDEFDELVRRYHTPNQ